MIIEVRERQKDSQYEYEAGRVDWCCSDLKRLFDKGLLFVPTIGISLPSFNPWLDLNDPDEPLIIDYCPCCGSNVLVLVEVKGEVVIDDKIKRE